MSRSWQAWHSRATSSRLGPGGSSAACAAAPSMKKTAARAADDSLAPSIRQFSFFGAEPFRRLVVVIAHGFVCIKEWWSNRLGCCLELGRRRRLLVGSLPPTVVQGPITHGL